MRLSPAIACVAALLSSTQAHSSGSYGNSLLSPSFRFTWVENVRKSFESDEQGVRILRPSVDPFATVAGALRVGEGLTLDQINAQVRAWRAGEE